MLTNQPDWHPGGSERANTSPANMNKAYFERGLSADVHKEHVVPFAHVLKHLLARKSSDSRSGRGIKLADITLYDCKRLISEPVAPPGGHTVTP